MANEFKPFAIKRFGEKINILFISVNELKSKSIIFDKLPNEVISNLYVFSLRILNQILRDVDGTGIVTVDGKMLLTNTIIKEKFLHPKKLVQQLPTAMYSASAMDNEMEFYFLFIQEKRLLPT